MTPRITTALIAVAIALGGTLLYTRALGYAPPYLIHDEAQGALQAHAIATTGHDLSGLSPLYSIPFVLAWLWSLGRFEQQPSPRRFVAACVWLALGMYSYLAAVVMMPLYLLMTLAMAARSLRWRAVVLAGVTFVACLLPMTVWYLTHPERNEQIVSAYQLEGGGSVLNAVGSRLGLYWRFFDPSYLFVSGDASMINSTRTAGLLPMAFVILLPLGLVAIARDKRNVGWIIAAGFLAAPIVSVISGGIEMNRVMFAIPFAVLIATYAVLGLWRSQSLTPKLVAALLVASVAGQFAGFYRYRVSAAPWFNGEPPATAAPGSKLICPAALPLCAALAASGSWHEIVRVPSLDGTHVYAILERTAVNKGD
jgi:hypothetical protein